MNQNTLIKGGHIQTTESFLFGRFECMMMPAFGSGVISSFFLFDDSKGFQNDWHEIDFEFLGRNTNELNTNIITTSNSVTDKNVNIIKTILEKRSEDTYWKLGIEWTPDYIQWSLSDVIIRRVNNSIHNKMKLMMNCWTGGSEPWSGYLNPAILPQTAKYPYVRYSAYENNNFVFKWQDEFNTIDPTRWQIATWNIGNTALVKENISISNSILSLRLSQ